MKPSSAQLALIHTAESAGISALMTLCGGVYQYVFTNGLNVAGLLGFLGTSFVACMLMMYKSVKSSPQLGQAVIDTSGEVRQSLDNLATVVVGHIGILQDIRKLMATPPTARGQAPAPSVQPPPSAAPAYGTLFPVTSNATANQAAPVPQQPFPPLNRWGTAEVPAPPQG